MTAIAALGPSSSKTIWLPIATLFVATSPSPSVTVITALTVAPRFTASSYEPPPVGCSIDSYCATLTTPVTASIEIANTALPPTSRPTTMPNSSVSVMASPSVVSRPETGTRNRQRESVVAPSSSSPVLLPAELTTGPALTANPTMSVDLVVTPSNTVSGPKTSLSLASPGTPGVAVAF